jgi:hypothetical protein
MNTTFQQTVNCQNTTCLNQGVHPIRLSRTATFRIHRNSLKKRHK